MSVPRSPTILERSPSPFTSVADMHILLVLAVLAALLIAEHSPAGPVANSGLRFALACAAMLEAPLLAWLGGKLVVWEARRAGVSQTTLLRWASVLRKIHAAFWFLTALAVLHFLGWTRLVDYNWGLKESFLVDDLLVLARQRQRLRHDEWLLVQRALHANALVDVLLVAGVLVDDEHVTAQLRQDEALVELA